MFSRVFFAILFLFGTMTASFAADRASPDEAKSMAERAAQHVETAGIEAAKKDFMTTGGEWHDRDLYVFMFDGAGITVAHGAKEALVGRDLTSLRDVDGKPFLQEMLNVQDTGWVDYKWQNPSTKAVEPKTSYIVRVGEHIVGVGAYK